MHESPPVMTVPLVVLAVGSVVAGWVGIPPLGHLDVDWLGHFLQPALTSVHGEAHHPAVGTELLLMGLSVAVAATGLWLAWRLWGPGRELEGDASFTRSMPALRRTLENKFWVDELYDRIVVRPLAWISRMLWKVVDTIVIDRLAVHSGPFLARLTGDVGRFTTTGNLRNYALYFLLGVAALAWWVLR